MKRSTLVILIITGILLIDQCLKLWVKTNMCIGETYSTMGGRAQLHFIENEGMAFGLKLGSKANAKLFLSLFRLVACIAIIFYIRHLLKEKAKTGFIICWAMIFAGAAGNLIDSAFYGVIFSESPGYYHGACHPAEMFPAAGGYAGFMHGRVVDMLHFPLFKVGNMVFFDPIFNIADASITTGVLVMLAFHRRFFLAPTPSKEVPAAEGAVADELPVAETAEEIVDNVPATDDKTSGHDSHGTSDDDTDSNKV